MVAKYKFKTEPFDHQRKALEACWNKESFALFMEMGTGKTKTTIDNIGYLYLKKRIDAALIVAPKSVYTVWKNEIETHLPSEIERSVFAWKVDKPKQYKKFLTQKDKMKFFLINVEALSTKKGIIKHTSLRFIKKTLGDDEYKRLNKVLRKTIRNYYKIE